MKLRREGWTAADLAADVLGGVLYAAGLVVFAQPAGFAPGGISGLALICRRLWGLPIGLTSLALNIPIILFSGRLLGVSFLCRSLRSMLFCTVFVDLVFPRLPVYTGSPFLAALYAGALLGAGLAVFYLHGSSSGGADFLTVSIQTLRPQWSLGAVTMALDLCVILLGWPVFGNVDAVLYGLAATAVTSFVIDRAMYGVRAGRLAIIITTRGQAVADRIAAETGRGATVLAGAGAYTGRARQTLLCACSRAQAHKVCAAAHVSDPAAFVMLVETREVFGEGFARAAENRKTPGQHRPSGRLRGKR